MSREKDEIAITAEKLGIRKLKLEQREVISRVLGRKDALALFPENQPLFRSRLSLIANIRPSFLSRRYL